MNPISEQGGRIFILAEKLDGEKRKEILFLVRWLEQFHVDILIIVPAYDLVLQSLTSQNIRFLFLKPKNKKIIQDQFIINQIVAFDPTISLFLTGLSYKSLLYSWMVHGSFFFSLKDRFLKRFLKLLFKLRCPSFQYWRKGVPMCTGDAKGNNLETTTWIPIPKEKLLFLIDSPTVLMSLKSYNWYKIHESHWLEKLKGRLAVYHCEQYLLIDSKIRYQGFDLDFLLSRVSHVLVSPTIDIDSFEVFEAFHRRIPVISPRPNISLVDCEIFHLENPNYLFTQLKDYDAQKYYSWLNSNIKIDNENKL